MSRLLALQKCNKVAIASVQNLSKRSFLVYFSTESKNPSIGNSTLENEEGVKVKATGARTVAALKKAPQNPVKRIIWTRPAAIVREDKELQENSDATADKAEIKLDDKSAAERAWLDSGYIEYMDNQRDKGWKT
jgi:hypothetical protein